MQAAAKSVLSHVRREEALGGEGSSGSTVRPSKSVAKVTHARCIVQTRKKGDRTKEAEKGGGRIRVKKERIKAGSVGDSEFLYPPPPL